VARRITCAARDLCGAAERARGEGGPLGERERRRGAALGGERGTPGAGRAAPPGQDRASHVTPGFRHGTPSVRRPRRLGPGPVPLGALGRAGSVAEHAWIACLGYRSLRDDLDHPRTPREARPVKRTLEIVNECLNPWEFFFGD
jgi:hypothetical protein